VSRGQELHLRVRIVRCGCWGGHHWYADIDDAADPQPDDPYWYADRCASQAEALSIALAELNALNDRLQHGVELERIVEATT
jgi:hypothetical protein